MEPETVWLPTFFKISIMFNKRGKLIEVWKNLREEKMTELSFLNE